jgi:hypothetical protein
METRIISDVPTTVGKSHPRMGSSDCLTPLKPEREGVINPASYVKWRESVIALELGLTSVEG